MPLAGKTEDGFLRRIASLLVLAAVGCTSIQTMLPRQVEPDPTALPGGDGPLRETCLSLAEAAVQQIPIQYREELRASVGLAAYGQCIEVMVVMVSVAMVAGDTTLEGVERVRVQLEGADSQFVVDTCDDHFRAWRFLRNPERGYERALEGATAGAQYDGWMDRCFRILRPLSLAAIP